MPVLSKTSFGVFASAKNIVSRKISHGTTESPKKPEMSSSHVVHACLLAITSPTTPHHHIMGMTVRVSVMSHRVAQEYLFMSTMSEHHHILMWACPI